MCTAVHRCLKAGGPVADVLLSVSEKAHTERMDHLVAEGVFPHAPVSLEPILPQTHLYSSAELLIPAPLASCYLGCYRISH